MYVSKLFGNQMKSMLNRYVINPLKSIPVLFKSRTEAIFVWSWITALSLLIAGNGFPPIRPSILIIISMIFIVSSVYLYNDIQDEDMDRLNSVKKDRPLPANNVNRDDAVKVVYLFSLLGLSIAYFVNFYSFLFVLTYYSLFYLYSHPKIRLKTRFLGKDLTIFLGNPLCGLIASYAVLNTFSLLTFYTSILTGLFMFTAGPLLNESSDLLEDKKFGVKSLSTMLSWERKVQLMIAGVLLLMTIIPLIQLQHGANIIIPVISVGISVVLLGLLYPLTKQYEQGKILKAKKFGKIYLFLFQLSFVFSAL